VGSFINGFFSFVILHTVGKTPWTGDQPVERPLATGSTTQTQNKHTLTVMPQALIEPHDPSRLEGEKCLCLRQRGNRDLHIVGSALGYLGEQIIGIFWENF
jgi:hypothetical protein